MKIRHGRFSRMLQMKVVTDWKIEDEGYSGILFISLFDWAIGPSMASSVILIFAIGLNKNFVAD